MSQTANAISRTLLLATIVIRTRAGNAIVKHFLSFNTKLGISFAELPTGLPVIQNQNAVAVFVTCVYVS